MTYFLKKTIQNNKGRVYLQIYESHYIPGKGKRNKCYKKIGYLDTCIDDGISNPIEYYQKEVDILIDRLRQNQELQISDKSTSLYAGHFLVKAMFDLLDMDNTIDIVASTYKWRYTFSDMFRTLCYSQILSPGSKLKAFERVIPNIYASKSYSYDQILDAIDFIGGDYHKYIEIINHHISAKWRRNLDKVYFDCTNYYFEIDLENDFLKKGPSKENRRCPLLGQSLLLDCDQIPLDTEFYPGNESERPYLRKRIEDMKSRNNITGRVIQVADKGLNCARNIYNAVIEAKDGYIFSKSIKGKNLSAEQKKWVIESDDYLNKWVDVRDNQGTLLYRYKTVKHRLKNNKYLDYGIYEYKCKLDPEDSTEVKFEVKEKRIVTYNPTLAKKQRAEILKEVEKLRALVTYKSIVKEDLGDAVKYVNIEAKDDLGKKVKIATSINEDKVNADLAYAGFNMIITSEVDADPREIYNIYHNLWRIEESFRVMKTYLETRPAFVSNEYTIYGHFLICYVSLTLMRLLELKTFNDEIPISQLFEFVRQYKVTKTQEDSYINNSTFSHTFSKIKEKLGLSKLGNVYLSKRDVDNILSTELD